MRGDGHMWLRAKVVIAADKKSPPVWILATSKTRNLREEKKKGVEQWLDGVRHKTESIEKGALLKHSCLINLSPSTFHMISSFPTCPLSISRVFLFYLWGGYFFSSLLLYLRIENCTVATGAAFQIHLLSLCVFEH